MIWSVIFLIFEDIHTARLNAEDAHITDLLRQFMLIKTHKKVLKYKICSDENSCLLIIKKMYNNMKLNLIKTSLKHTGNVIKTND